MKTYSRESFPFVITNDRIHSFVRKVKSAAIAAAEVGALNVRAYTYRTTERNIVS
jgi:hypothetical protein